jgi:hypothetical protein
MHVSEDFSKLDCCWRESIPLSKKFLLNNYVPIYCEYILPQRDNERIINSDIQDSMSISCNIKYNAKIMICSGLNPDHKSNQISHYIKFLVAKQERSDLMCIGGPWSRDIDGGDPYLDLSVLHKTALRWCFEITNINLNPSNLIKFMQITYYRPKDSRNDEHNEISVIFLADISQFAPTVEQVRYLLHLTL